LKKARVQKIFSSLQLNCSGTRCIYRVQELKKAQLELCLPEKSREEGSFSLAHCLDGAAMTGGEGLVGGGGIGIGGGVMVRMGAELVCHKLHLVIFPPILQQFPQF